jgi:hypothetical protein
MKTEPTHSVGPLWPSDPILPRPGHHPVTFTVGFEPVEVADGGARPQGRHGSGFEIDGQEMPTHFRGQVILQTAAPRRHNQPTVIHVEAVGVLECLSFRQNRQCAARQDEDFVRDDVGDVDPKTGSCGKRTCRPIDRDANLFGSSYS